MILIHYDFIVTQLKTKESLKMNIDNILSELQLKIYEIKQLKSKVNQGLQYYIDCKYLQSMIKEIRPAIQKELDEYNQFQKEEVCSLIRYYEHDRRNSKNYYQYEIDELQSQVTRQYRVIGLMKKQVEDLMILVNYKQMFTQDSECNVLMSQEGRESKRNTIEGLEVIQEEDTERTFLSSARSEPNINQNYIKIEEQSIVGSSEACMEINSIEEPQQIYKKLDGMQDQSKIEMKQNKSEVMNNQLLEFQEIASNENQIDSDLQLRRNNTYHYNQTTQSNQSFCEQYQSVPISLDGNKEQKSSLVKDRTKTGLNDIIVETGQTQPKTKQFLQQFRKTFNKCLSTMQVNKKHSTKTNLNVKKQFESNTFRKNPKNDCHKKAVNDTKEKNQSSKLISTMLRELDNNNKFIIGHRKIELKYEGDKRDNQRCGNGLLYYSNGLCFEGEFKNGVRSGYGILKFNHIEIYNGDWLNDQISGQGKIRNCAIINKKKLQKNQSNLGKWISYCGDFKSNRFDGEGTLYLQGGEKFLGKFICGLACGEGTLYKKNGEVENGIWKNNFLTERF